MKIKSIQRGNGNIASNSNTENLAISEVDLSKTLITHFSFMVSGQAPLNYAYRAYARLSSATTLRIDKNTNAGQMTYSYEIVEFE